MMKTVGSLGLICLVTFAVLNRETGRSLQVSNTHLFANERKHGMKKTKDILGLLNTLKVETTGTGRKVREGKRPRQRQSQGQTERERERERERESKTKKYSLTRVNKIHRRKFV